MVQLERSILEGLAYCAAFGAMILGSLAYNPRIWLHDYPQPIRAAVPPLNAQERRIRTFFTIPFVALFFGMPIILGANFAASLGDAVTFVAVFVHVLIITQMANLFDAVVIDWLILAEMKPKFSIIPGTEGLLHILNEPEMVRQGWINFGKGVVICTVLSAIIAGAIVLVVP